MKYYPVQVALLENLEYDSEIFLVEKKETTIDVEMYVVEVSRTSSSYVRYYRSYDLTGHRIPRCSACGSIKDHHIPMDVDETAEPPYTCGCDNKEITQEEMEKRLDMWVIKMNECPEKYTIYLKPFKASF